MPAAAWPALRSSLPCMRSTNASRSAVAEVPGDAQRPAGPPGGGGQPLLGQQVPQRHPEGDAGLSQQAHRLWFGMPGRDAGFQPGDQRPQLADRFGGPAAVAGNVGQPDHGHTEREHGGEVGVVRVGDPEHERRDGQRAGNMGQRAAVGDAAAAALDHGNVGPVKPKQVRQLLLGQRAGMPVGTQDRPQVPAGLGAARRRQPGRRGHRRAPVAAAERGAGTPHRPPGYPMASRVTRTAGNTRSSQPPT